MTVTGCGRQRLPEPVMSLPPNPAPGALPERDFLPLNQPALKPGSHGDVNRGMPLSVINWQG